MPFPAEFFDAIVSIDSFPYYGTDDSYLNYLARLVKPNGLIGIVGAGLMQEMSDGVPEHLRAWWTPDLWCLHSASWWRRHWGRTGILEVELADTLPDGWRLWRDWLKVIAPDNLTEIQAVEADRGRYIGYVRVVGRRRSDIALGEPIVAISTKYAKTPLLHS